MKELQEEIENFVKERGWTKFHNPKELLLGVVEEVGEFRNIVKWEPDPQRLEDIIKKNYEEVEDTFGDMLWFMASLANRCNVDLETALKKVIERNKKRFPKEKYLNVHTNLYSD
jgi:NTP pyrophosphatase (non-canonical NTP hydrolase)